MLSIMLNGYLLFNSRHSWIDLLKNDPPFKYSKVFYIGSNGNIELLDSLKNANGNYLPAKSFILDSIGNYLLPDGKLYSLRKPGIYRFFDGVNNRQVLVAGDRLTPLELIKMLSWTVVHGNKDNDNWKSWNTILSNREMSLTCGRIASVAARLCNYYNIRCRILDLRTLEKPNGYDDGHVMLEVFDNETQKWQLLDPDNNSFFSDSLGNVLNLKEFIVNLHENKLKIVDLSLDPRIDISGFGKYTFAATLIYSEQCMIDWYKRVSQSLETDNYKSNLVRLNENNPIPDSLMLVNLQNALYNN
jgi:hypothetical protein